MEQVSLLERQKIKTSYENNKVFPKINLLKGLPGCAVMLISSLVLQKSGDVALIPLPWINLWDLGLGNLLFVKGTNVTTSRENARFLP